MAVKIRELSASSPLRRHRIPNNASLVSLDGHEIADVLDYGFYATAARLSVVIRDDDTGQLYTYKVDKDEYEELGVESDSFLMDGQHRCTNNCVFCFIDQLPPGLRDSLYFKDDDERLSFLFGNYITLTNLSDHEIDRIIEMHISPINVSVHTTDPELRCKLMGNRFAGEKLRYLDRLAAAGVQLNCQIVLCRGLNDGEQLRKTLRDLLALAPAVRSIACVPAGLTAHREGLYPLKAYDADTARGVMDVIDAVRRECEARGGEPIVYPADEFFLLVGEPVPPLDYYGELLQLENGVGMLALLEDEFSSALGMEDDADCDAVSTILTGEAAYPTIVRLVQRAKTRFPSLDCRVLCIKNEFFGGNVTVAGLLTAGDILKQTDGKVVGRALIPSSMLRREGDMFLDSVTLEGFSERLGAPVRVTDDGADLLDALLGR